MTLAQIVTMFLVLWLLVKLVYPHGLATYLDIHLPTQFKMTYSYWFEIVSWFVLWLFLYLLSGRFLFSGVMILLLMLAFVAGNAEKIRLLHAPLMVSDVFALRELALQENMFSTYLGYAAGVFAIFVVAGWLAWKKSGKNTFVFQHQMVFVLGLLLLLLLVLANRFSISKYLVRKDLFFNKVNPVLSVFQYGGLATLVQSALFVPEYKDMVHYNRAAVRGIIEKYGLDSAADHSLDAVAEPVNLILVLTEAFTDPDEMGWQMTRDPLPAFHRVRKDHGGRILSPVLGGRSANAEFELLTGFSMRFTPANSIPYTDLIKNEIPSLARYLGQHGYLSMAVHIASLDFFNYKEVYEKQGFGMFTTLWDKAPKADPMGMHASREELFKLIVKASTFHQPYFLFTFPNYTHGDWRYDTFADSQLDVIDPENRLEGEEKERVKTYINALHYSDAFFQDLIDHFSRAKEKTLIVMLGDHQPFLEGYRQKAWKKMVEQYGEGELAKVMANYWVPVAMWSNFDRPRENRELSMNFMPSYLIEQLGLQPTGFYRFNQILKDKIGVFSWIIKDADGSYSFIVPPKFRQLVKDYELIQYDILQGKNYFGQLLKEKARDKPAR